MPCNTCKAGCRTKVASSERAAALPLKSLVVLATSADRPHSACTAKQRILAAQLLLARYADPDMPQLSRSVRDAEVEAASGRLLLHPFVMVTKLHIKSGRKQRAP